ncbi:hypothetical protein V6N11_024705 [Hibiscus sabdariffa]|uniref:Chromo domain-containing protein n=1 Tax=Hibiscus sabdariffa TaxID=183260 RepID=A0ABR2QMX4_9ROSI
MCRRFGGIDRIRLMIMPVEEIDLNPDLSYDEEPIDILASDSKVLRGRTIELVKVEWRHRGVEEATWERNDDMMDQFPYLFPSEAIWRFEMIVYCWVMFWYCFGVVSDCFGCESDVKSSYNVKLLFAASFDSKMGCLRSVFAAKKQRKPIREVRTRSLAWGRQEGKEDQGITFVQVRFCGYGSMYKQWGGSVFYIFGLEYRYSSVVSVPEFNTGIRVSVLLDEYRYPFEVM